MAKQKEIYFHVGMGRAASTYLQYDVFPKFKGIKYVQRTAYRRFDKIVAKSAEKKLFTSREFDQQFDEEVAKFSKRFPQTHAIVVFRRHDGWIASQYRRFVKNGNHLTFKEFIDIENDKGLFSIEDLSYFPKIKYLEDHFDHKPLVVFYEEMIENPQAFLDKIVIYLGANYDIKDINLEKRHASYNKNQIKAIYWLGKYFNVRKRRMHPNPILHTIFRFGLGAFRYIALFIAGLLPDSVFDQSPLIEKEELEAIRAYFADDWKKCLEYAKMEDFSKTKRAI